MTDKKRNIAKFPRNLSGRKDDSIAGSVTLAHIALRALPSDNLARVLNGFTTRNLLNSENEL